MSHPYLSIARADGSKDAPYARTQVGPVSVKIVLGHPNPTFLQGLQSLVIATHGLQVHAATCQQDAFLDHCADVGEGVALLGHVSGPEGTPALLRRLSRRAPGMRALLIADPEAPLPLREALEAGAIGIVNASDDVEGIRAAILAVAQGRRHVCLPAAQRLAESMASKVTAREMDVLRLLCRGMANKVIARELAIEIGTVKTHVRALMSKLDGASRTDVVLRACRHGLISIAASGG